ncbi:MAG: exo-alpha-sialidase [Candidatus Eremiobacteraeota bacterium]|nr:exo-alpha-sialidase [Candidatus Eremiobacteraeota bacterium]
MKRFKTVPFLAVFFLGAALPAAAGLTFYSAYLKKAPVVQISVDQFSNTSSQHATEVEPSIFANGSTIVAVAQEGRFTTGGASDITFATSTNSGQSWTYGSLPGITKIQNSKNPYDRVSDPAITYDPKHGLWLASTLPLTGETGQIPLVSSSPDGLNWNAPVAVGKNNGDFMDKNWIVCDGFASSPYYGNCYTEFDDNSEGDQMMMTTSTDGGKTWSKPVAIDNAFGLGGQPVVQPNGHVVVPFLPGGVVEAFQSDNGGMSWSAPVTVANENDHQVAGDLRTSPLPSARTDDGGTIYVSWQDCSYRTNCNENDIIYVTSTDGTHWTATKRVPIDPLTSSVDHFIPGISIAPGTMGANAHIGIAYYYYPQANCSTSTCALTLGYISSKNGGKTWSPPTQLGTPMHISWLANTDQGYMVGDYIASTFAANGVHIAATQALKPGAKYDEFLVSNSTTVAAQSVELSSFGERPLPGAHSDHKRFDYPPGD